MARAADQHPMRSMDRGMNNASTARPAALVVASLAAALQLNAPAMAQDAGAPASHAQVDRRSETATLDKVMVIGSNIRDAIGGGASPVIVIDREAIDRSGVPSLQQLFEKLPQNFAAAVWPPRTASWASPSRCFR
ncbi:hypothetical protein G6F22_016292 [Rhizopus arrhizus]|nr:hypothetical protein G6F22_016292 [Rhizopus arrhizus]